MTEKNGLTKLLNKIDEMPKGTIDISKAVVDYEVLRDEFHEKTDFNKHFYGASSKDIIIQAKEYALTNIYKKIDEGVYNKRG